MVEGIKSRSFDNRTTCVIKAIRARIQTSDEQSKQFEDLYVVWNDMLEYCIHNHLS